VLVLTRKLKESIMIGDDIEVTVLSSDGDKIRLGIQAPTVVPVYRTEVYLEIRRERAEGDARPEADGHDVVVSELPTAPGAEEPPELERSRG
jgi:carbon storage regulator